MALIVPAAIAAGTAGTALWKLLQNRQKPAAQPAAAGFPVSNAQAMLQGMRQQLGAQQAGGQISPVGVGSVSAPNFGQSLSQTENLFQQAFGELQRRQAAEQQFVGQLPGQFDQQNAATVAAMQGNLANVMGAGRGSEFEDSLTRTALTPFLQAQEMGHAGAQGVIPTIGLGVEQLGTERRMALESARAAELNRIREMQAQMEFQAQMANQQAQMQAALQAQSLQAQRDADAPPAPRTSFGAMEVSTERVPLLSAPRLAQGMSRVQEFNAQFNDEIDKALKRGAEDPESFAIAAMRNALKGEKDAVDMSIWLATRFGVGSGTV